MDILSNINWRLGAIATVKNSKYLTEAFYQDFIQEKNKIQKIDEISPNKPSNLFQDFILICNTHKHFKENYQDPIYTNQVILNTEQKNEIQLLMFGLETEIEQQRFNLEQYAYIEDDRLKEQLFVQLISGLENNLPKQVMYKIITSVETNLFDTFFYLNEEYNFYFYNNQKWPIFKTVDSCSIVWIDEPEFRTRLSTYFKEAQSFQITPTSHYSPYESDLTKTFSEFFNLSIFDQHVDKLEIENFVAAIISDKPNINLKTIEEFLSSYFNKRQFQLFLLFLTDKSIDIKPEQAILKSGKLNHFAQGLSLVLGKGGLNVYGLSKESIKNYLGARPSDDLPGINSLIPTEIKNAPDNKIITNLRLEISQLQTSNVKSFLKNYITSLQSVNVQLRD
jgi:hypothetical protein